MLPSSNGDSLDPWRYINHVLSKNGKKRVSDQSVE